MAENKLLLKGLAWLICCAISCSAWAGRPVRVYEVDLKGGQSESSVQDAMREVLVRATGRRESAADPALANLISEAQNYVKGYSPPAHGQSQVIFDGVAVERAIVAAGRSVWDRNRPFTLVVLYPPLHAPLRMRRGWKWNRPQVRADFPLRWSRYHPLMLQATI